MERFIELGCYIEFQAKQKRIKILNDKSEMLPWPTELRENRIDQETAISCNDIFCFINMVKLIAYMHDLNFENANYIYGKYKFIAKKPIKEVKDEKRNKSK